MKVVISANIKVGEKRVYEGEANSPLLEIMKETIPARYNAKTTLTLDVSDKPIDVQYDLESK